jgi:hypothetical protein
MGKTLNKNNTGKKFIHYLWKFEILV